MKLRNRELARPGRRGQLAEVVLRLSSLTAQALCVASLQSQRPRRLLPFPYLRPGIARLVHVELEYACDEVEA
jgi:hypothetical protein